ncbi:DUF177 domain-containing protein [Thermodesulfobacteriota bacterium]
MNGLSLTGIIMNLRVEEVPEDGREIILDDIDEDEARAFIERGREVDLKLLDAPRGCVRASRSEERVYLDGTVEDNVRTVCCRCLEPFELPLAVRFESTLAPPPKGTVEMDVELSGEDLETAVYYGSSIDLAGIILEQLVVNLPIKPLCSDACKGLCPRCGVNRNTENCGCVDREVDPRFAILKKLKVDE